jgi:hypothetical protein
LVADLKILEDGDQAEIGERGVNLSGKYSLFALFIPTCLTLLSQAVKKLEVWPILS